MNENQGLHYGNVCCNFPELNNEWSVQCFRYVTLKTIVTLSDDPAISLPSLPVDQAAHPAQQRHCSRNPQLPAESIINQTFAKAISTEFELLLGSASPEAPEWVLIGQVRSAVMTLAPLTIERRLFQPNDMLGFCLRGGGGEDRAAFWFTSSAYADAEAVVEMAMLRGSHEDLSSVPEAIRHAATLARFGLPEQDLAYVLTCLQGISHYRAHVWPFPGDEGDPQNDLGDT